VAASNSDPLTESVALSKRLKLPYLRRALTDLPTAKAKRWILPSRYGSCSPRWPPAAMPPTYAPAASAGFPAGKTFGDRDEAASSIPTAEPGCAENP
jgi:hypothetical protein